MNIQEANKKAGDLDQICLPDYKGWYCLIVDGEPCWYDNKTDSLLRNVLGREAIREDWEVCQRAKEIRPEKAGELWETPHGYKFFTIMVGHSIHFIDERGQCWDPDYIKPDWTRRFPLKEDDSVERIVIEGVEWKNLEGYIVPYGGYIWRTLLNKPKIKMILEMPKNCSHGKGLNDYCEPCGRTHGG